MKNYLNSLLLFCLCFAFWSCQHQKSTSKTDTGKSVTMELEEGEKKKKEIFKSIPKKEKDTIIPKDTQFDSLKYNIGKENKVIIIQNVDFPYYDIVSFYDKKENLIKTISILDFQPVDLLKITNRETNLIAPQGKKSTDVFEFYFSESDLNKHKIDDHESFYIIDINNNEENLVVRYQLCIGEAPYSESIVPEYCKSYLLFFNEKGKVTRKLLTKGSFLPSEKEINDHFMISSSNHDFSPNCVSVYSFIKNKMIYEECESNIQIQGAATLIGKHALGFSFYYHDSNIELFRIIDLKNSTSYEISIKAIGLRSSEIGKINSSLKINDKGMLSYKNEREEMISIDYTKQFKKVIK